MPHAKGAKDAKRERAARQVRKRESRPAQKTFGMFTLASTLAAFAILT